MPNVLIINDSSTTRLYYREILEGVGFTVEEAINGIEGLEKAAVESFDLMLVDLNMPKMDGYSFLAHLRASVDLQAVPTMMISTQAREVDRNKAHSAGANVYLVKPVEPIELADRCLLLTGQSRAQRISA